MTDHTPLDDANSTIRRLLHQRKCLREERDRAFEEGALSMRERAAQQLEYTPPIDSPPEHAALKAAYAEAIRALPPLPDADDADTLTQEQGAWARLKAEIPRLYGRDRAEDLPHDSEYGTALHDVLVAMKRIEHGSPLLADVDDPEPQDETPRDTELIQQVRALVKRYGAPWVAYEAARQARH